MNDITYQYTLCLVHQFRRKAKRSCCASKTFGTHGPELSSSAGLSYSPAAPVDHRYSGIRNECERIKNQETIVGQERAAIYSSGPSIVPIVPVSYAAGNNTGTIHSADRHYFAHCHTG